MELKDCHTKNKWLWLSQCPILSLKFMCSILQFYNSTYMICLRKSQIIILWTFVHLFCDCSNFCNISKYLCLITLIDFNASLFLKSSSMSRDLKRLTILCQMYNFKKMFYILSLENFQKCENWWIHVWMCRYWVWYSVYVYSCSKSNF